MVRIHRSVSLGEPLGLSRRSATGQTPPLGLYKTLALTETTPAIIAALLARRKERPGVVKKGAREWGNASSWQRRGLPCWHPAAAYATFASVTVTIRQRLRPLIPRNAACRAYASRLLRRAMWRRRPVGTRQPPCRRRLPVRPAACLLIEALYFSNGMKWCFRMRS